MTHLSLVFFSDHSIRNEIDASVVKMEPENKFSPTMWKLSRNGRWGVMDRQLEGRFSTPDMRG